MASGRPVVVDQLTTAHQLVTADPTSGQLIAEISALPVRVRAPVSPNGWVPIDPTLQLTAAGTLRPVATAVDLEFSAGGSAVPLARMGKGEHWLELAWPGDLPVPLLDGPVATYVDAVGPGIDLVVQAGAVGFSHYLVVRHARAAAHPALRQVSLGLATSNLTAEDAPGGTTAFVDADRDDVFVVPPARMWDSGAARPAADGERAVSSAQLLEPDLARSAVMPVTVTSSMVTVVPDQAMLHDPETVFPVVIDPSYSDGHTYWRMVWSNGISFPNSSTEQARVGYDGWSGENKRSRVFYRFNVSVMRNREIVSARFEHRQVHSPNHDCSLSVFGPAVEFGRTAAIDSSTVWGGPSGSSSTYTTTRTVNGHSSVCGGWTRTTWDAKAAVNYEASRGNSSLTIRLRSTNESDRDGWRRFANTNGFPKLIATYNSPPSVPTSLNTTSPTTTCATSTDRPWVNDNSPNLRATLSSPSGQNLRGRFQRQHDTGSGFGSTSESVTSYGSSGSVRSVGLTGLGDGRWRWRVRAEDTATESAYSSWCYFQLKTTTPPAPTLSVSAPYSFDVWVEPDGLPEATLTVGRAGDTSVDRFQYAIGSATPTTTRTMSSTGTVTFTPPYGVTTISVRLLDRAGNLGPIQTATLRVMSPRAQHAWLMNDEGQTPGETADLARPTGSGQALRYGPEVVWADGDGTETGGDPNDRALRFDGTGAGASADGPVIFELDSFTVTAWVKLDTAEPGHGTFIAASQDGVANSTFRLGYALATESWAVWRNGTEGGGSFRVEGPTPIDQVGAGGIPFPDGQPDWQHLAAVYDAPAGVVRLYVDGNLAGEQTYTFPAAPGGAFRVGRGNNGGGAYGGGRGGRVDDVMVFDAALTEAQIRVLRGVTNAEQLEVERDALFGHQLAGWWPLHEGSGTTGADATDHGAHLSLQPGASWSPDGPDGQNALALDGLTGHARTSTPVLDTAAPFTVAAWARADHFTDWHTIVAQQGTEVSPFRLMWRTGQGWCFTMRLTDAPGGTLRHACSPTAQAGVWTHLAGVYDPAAGEARLYVNGKLATTRAVENSWQAGGPLLVGRTFDPGGVGNDEYFAGRIAQVRAYQRTLSPAEVAQLLANVAPPSDGNQPPVAGFNHDCTGFNCQFDASAAFDPDGHLVSYRWEFGDGTISTAGAVVPHTYPGGGSYDMTLMTAPVASWSPRRTSPPNGRAQAASPTTPAGPGSSAHHMPASCSSEFLAGLVRSEG